MPATLSLFTLYRDPFAAVAWLTGAFGMELVNSYGAEEGTLDHAELRLGEAVVMVQAAADGQTASPLVEGSTSRAPVLSLDSEAEVDALFVRVRDAGATVVQAPGTTPWGNYRFEVLDPEGHQWSVGNYRPGEPWDVQW